MDENQFNKELHQITEKIIVEMAENTNVSLSNFYSMTCFLENLTFFGPVLHSIIERKISKSQNSKHQ